MIGKANDYLPYFVYTFMEMGKLGIGKDRGKFKLIKVSACQDDGSLTEIFNINDGILKSVNNKIDLKFFTSHSSLFTSHLTLFFNTPVRIKDEGDLLSTDIPFSLLIKRLYERAVLLSYYHCQGEMQENFNNPLLRGGRGCVIEGTDDVRIKENNLRWHDWERYSNRKGRMKLGGLVGSITYEGNIDSFLPLLRIGEYIHVGKAATFGLGRYRVKVAQASLPVI